MYLDTTEPLYNNNSSSNNNNTEMYAVNITEQHPLYNSTDITNITSPPTSPPPLPYIYLHEPREHRLCHSSANLTCPVCTKPVGRKQGKYTKGHRAVRKVTVWFTSHISIAGQVNTTSKRTETREQM